jgi:hypothetical protein
MAARVCLSLLFIFPYAPRFLLAELRVQPTLFYTYSKFITTVGYFDFLFLELP